MAANVEQVGGYDVFKYHQYIPQNELAALKWFRSKKQSIELSISQILIDNGVIFTDIIFVFTSDINDVIFNCSFESINKRIDPMLVRLLEEQLDKLSQRLSSYRQEPLNANVVSKQGNNESAFNDEMTPAEFSYLGDGISCSINHHKLKTAANDIILQPSRENIIKLIYLASKTLCASDHNVDISDVFECVTKRLSPIENYEDEIILLDQLIGGKC